VGFGDTAKNSIYYSLEQQTTLLEEFTDAMGIGKIALVGHGLGAIVGLLYTPPPGASRPDHGNQLSLLRTALSARLRTAQTGRELADWLLARSPSTESVWTEASKTDPRAISASLTGLQNTTLAGCIASSPPRLVRSWCKRLRHRPPDPDSLG